MDVKDYKEAAQRLDAYAKGFKIGRTYSLKLGLMYIDKPKSRHIIEVLYRAWRWRQATKEMKVTANDTISAMMRLGITMRGFGIQLNRQIGFIDAGA